MNPDIKARWVAALRNPEAKQLRGNLGKVYGGRCCLGVLCDIAVEDGVIQPPEADEFDGNLSYGGMESLPPVEVNEWAGFDPDAASPALLTGGRWGSTFDDASLLAHIANDELKLTFPQIADLIEWSL